MLFVPALNFSSGRDIMRGLVSNFDISHSILDSSKAASAFHFDMETRSYYFSLSEAFGVEYTLDIAAAALFELSPKSTTVVH